MLPVCAWAVLCYCINHNKTLILQQKSPDKCPEFIFDDIKNKIIEP